MPFTRSLGRTGLLALLLGQGALGGLGARAKAEEQSPPKEDPLHGARLVDSIAAIVGRRIVTLSQLRLEARIALALHAPLETAGGPLGKPLLGSTLDYVISEDLVEEEASRLQVFPIAPAEVKAAEVALSQRFPSPEAYERFLARFQILHEWVLAILRRGLRASRYLENRLKFQSQPSEAEVTAQLGLEPKIATGPEARSLARAYLQRRKFQALAATLVGELRARSDVRILADFSPTAGEVPGAGPEARPIGRVGSEP